MLGSVTIVVIGVRQYGQREAPPPRRVTSAAHASQHCEWPQGRKRVVRGASMQMTHMRGTSASAAGSAMPGRTPWSSHTRSTVSRALARDMRRCCRPNVSALTMPSSSRAAGSGQPATGSRARCSAAPSVRSSSASSAASLACSARRPLRATSRVTPIAYASVVCEYWPLSA